MKPRARTVEDAYKLYGIYTTDTPEQRWAYLHCKKPDCDNCILIRQHREYLHRKKKEGTTA